MVWGQTNQIVFSRINEIVEKGSMYLFITLSSSHLFNKTDFEQYRFNEHGESKGEFTQYPFFVRFCPFFYVFASPWQSMRFFILIFMCPYPH